MAIKVGTNERAMRKITMMVLATFNRGNVKNVTNKRKLYKSKVFVLKQLQIMNIEQDVGKPGRDPLDEWLAGRLV